MQHRAARHRLRANVCVWETADIYMEVVVCVKPRRRPTLSTAQYSMWIGSLIRGAEVERCR